MHPSARQYTRGPPTLTRPHKVIDEHLRGVLTAAAQQHADLRPLPDAERAAKSGARTQLGMQQSEQAPVTAARVGRVRGAVQCVRPSTTPIIGTRGLAPTARPAPNPVALPPEPPDALTPWFAAYRAEFMRLLRFGDHEALDHPVGGKPLCGGYEGPGQRARLRPVRDALRGLEPGCPCQSTATRLHPNPSLHLPPTFQLQPSTSSRPTPTTRRRTLRRSARSYRRRRLRRASSRCPPRTPCSSASMCCCLTRPRPAPTRPGARAGVVAGGVNEAAGRGFRARRGRRVVLGRRRLLPPAGASHARASPPPKHTAAPRPTSRCCSRCTALRTWRCLP
jgi:hypothetical protein